MINNLYDTEKFTEADFKLARDNWRRDLCGDEITNDKSVPGIENILLMIDLDSEQFRRDMNRAADAKILFGEEAPVLSGELKIQYDAIYRMALPFGTVGCRGFRSPELLSDVLYALEWMYNNMYGENVLTDSSFRSWKHYDWWDWFIGASCPMMNTLMIIEDGINKELIKKYTTPIAFLRYHMKTEPIVPHMMSRMMSMTPLALLTEDRALLKQMYEECKTVLEIRDEGDDMRRDLCCMTHGLVYNIGYGFINLDRTARIIKILSTTPLAYPIAKEKQYFLMKMIRYTFAPSMYKGRPFAPMNGRNMQTTETVLNPLKYFYYVYGVFGDAEDMEIKQIIRRNRTDRNKELLISHFDKGVTLEEYRNINSGGARSKYEPVTKIVTYSMLYDALTNEKYDTPPYELGYMWYSGDTAVQFHKDSMVGVRMCSSRAPSYECINYMNADGWYTGEGAVYVYTPDTPEEYSRKWWESADKHLIPGTTVDERVREPMNFEYGYMNNQNFVGGVALEERFLALTMDHEAFHNEVEGRAESNGHGRGWPIHISTLTSKKSYFLMDEAAVFVGCDVCAKDGYAVRTVVDNRLLAEGESIVVNGERVSFALGDTVRDDVKYIYFDKCGAYYFPLGGKLIIRFYEKEGERRVAVWFDHGVDPTAGKYAYVFRPGISADEAGRYDLSDIEFLRNDSEIQAVRERHSGLVAIAFRGAYELVSIKAMQPMVCMTKEDKDGKILSLAACDPTQALDSFAFAVAGEGLGSDDGCVSLHTDEGKTEVKIDCDSARGRAYYMKKG